MDERNWDLRDQLYDAITDAAMLTLQGEGFDVTPEGGYGDRLAQLCAELTEDLLAEVPPPEIDICDCCLAPLAELGEIL